MSFFDVRVCAEMYKRGDARIRRNRFIWQTSARAAGYLTGNRGIYSGLIVSWDFDIQKQTFFRLTEIKGFYLPSIAIFGNQMGF